MRLSFSRNLHDSDGDVFDECILLHYDPNVILKFDDMEELEQFKDDITDIINEINDVTY